MRPKSVIHVVMAAVLGVAACSSEPAASPGADPGEPRDLATIVRASIEVGEVEPSAARLRRAIARHGGHVRSATLSERASVIARVPVDRLDAFRRELRALGEVRSESEEVEDVTEQRADHGARLRSARREEERLHALMSDRAASLGDVIAIEERLGVVRERIERHEAAGRAIAQRVELAEAHVELSAPGAPFWRDPIGTVASAGAWGIDAAAAMVVGATALAAGLGPSALLVAALLAALTLRARGLSRRRSRA